MEKTKQEQFDLDAAYAYVETMKPRADAEVCGGSLWYGWALRQAFLDGIAHARKEEAPSPAWAGDSSQIVPSRQD